MSYFSGQGRVLVADRDANGNPGAFRFVGNVPAFKIDLVTDVVEHTESQSGNRIVDAHIHKKKDCNINMTLEDFSALNLAQLLYGVTASKTGATVSAESVVVTGLVAGDYVRTKYPNISSVVVKDNAAAVQTLGTAYTIDSPKFGTLKIAGAIASQPIKIDYTYATHNPVQLLTSAIKERYVRFEGINTVDNTNVLVELYRVIFDPTKSIDMIQDDLAKFETPGNVLYDATRAADTDLGGFGRIILL